jgi:hypothetical protein
VTKVVETNYASIFHFFFKFKWSKTGIVMSKNLHYVIFHKTVEEGLKGQCQEIVVEMRLWDSRLGLNYSTQTHFSVLKWIVSKRQRRICHNSYADLTASMKDHTANCHSSLRDLDPTKKIQTQPDQDLDT